MSGVSRLSCSVVTRVSGAVLLLGIAALISASCTGENQHDTTTDVTASHAVESLDLPARPGEPPNVTEGIPHIQLDQTSTDEMLAELASWAFSLDEVVEQPSRVSLPGARALTVASDLPANDDAMLAAREFAHIHPQPNGGSLHLRLSQAGAREVVDEGWGVYHPFAIDGSVPNLIMVFAPRDSTDLEHVKAIIEASVAFATSP